VVENRIRLNHLRQALPLKALVVVFEVNWVQDFRRVAETEVHTRIHFLLLALDLLLALYLAQ